MDKGRGQTFCLGEYNAVIMRRVGCRELSGGWGGVRHRKNPNNYQDVGSPLVIVSFYLTRGAGFFWYVFRPLFPGEEILDYLTHGPIIRVLMVQVS